MAIGNFPLKGKICAVTGGGSGISLAFVQLAASQGARVIIADLRLSSEAEELVEENQKILFVKCDVTEWKDLQNLIGVSEEKFGDVPDVYVAGAGIFDPPWSNFWSDTESDRYATIDINISHPIKLTRIAMRVLLSKNKPGVVVMVSSIAGLQAHYPSALYCATKHALVGFTRSMAPAHDEEGVKVVCICPGAVATPLWTTSPGIQSQYSYSPTRALTPSAVAAAIAELVTEEKYAGGTVMWITVGGKDVVDYSGFDKELLEKAYGVDGKADWKALDEVKERMHGPIRELLMRERVVGGTDK